MPSSDRWTGRRRAVLLLVWVIGLMGVMVGPVRADIYFGHTDAVDDRVDKVDEKVREETNGGSPGNDNSGGNSGCTVSYPEWLEGVEDRADLKQALLVPDTAAGANLDVKNNPDFDESKDVTADTILQRCNTYFTDIGDSNVEHWVYCRAFQLPSGDTFTDLTTLKNASDSSPSELYTASFFHGSNIDDPSENWLMPLVNQYKDRCRSRPLNVIWMGVWVTENGSNNKSLGNKWHVTSTSWKDTVLYQVMEPSVLNFTGHTTASCPQDASDTRGLYVGGTAETEGRRITDKFTGDQALWVGQNSSNSGACFSGTAGDNPVNANGNGVQLEYQVTVPDTDPAWVDPDDIADYILDEF